MLVYRSVVFGISEPSTLYLCQNLTQLEISPSQELRRFPPRLSEKLPPPRCFTKEKRSENPRTIPSPSMGRFTYMNPIRINQIYVNVPKTWIVLGKPICKNLVGECFVCFFHKLISLDCSLVGCSSWHEWFLHLSDVSHRFFHHFRSSKVSKSSHRPTNISPTFPCYLDSMLICFFHHFICLWLNKS